MTKLNEFEKIGFYLNVISDGGQTKVLIDIANGLTSVGFKVDFFYREIKNKSHMLEALGSVNFIPLMSNGHISSALKLRSEIKKRGLNTLISGGSVNNCFSVIATLLAFRKNKLILTEHVSISEHIKNSSSKLALLIPYLVKLLYPFADALVSVSKGVKIELENKLNLKHKNSLVIYNPIVNEKLISKSRCDVTHKWLNGVNKVFLGVGRLNIQKDFATLITAFKILSGNPVFKLIILGEGEDRVPLEKLVKKLNLRNQVDLVGRVDNPYAYMGKANVFVLSSLFEGLPTVLIEALACGIPAVSTDCPHGASEILENGKWGALVPISDSRSLARAMLSSLELSKYSAIKRAADFSYESSIGKYQILINNLCSK